MIGRLGVIFLIIGSGYVFSVFALKSLAGMIALPELAGIGKIDSYVQLIIGVLGFGMQTDAMRRISVSENWVPIFTQAQSARLTLSYILLVFIVLVWFDGFWLALLLAPVIAGSGDYALYARGFPVVAALISWVRVVLPLAACLAVATLQPEGVVITFLISTALVFLATNYAIARTLRVPTWSRPSWKSLRLYQQTLPIGVINICLYFFGLGVIIIAQPFYSDSSLAVAFLALKFYIIYKGAIRVMHQAFISQMRDQTICFTLDRLAILASLLVVAAVGCFPATTISLMFGESFLANQLVFVQVGAAALIFSVCASLASHLLLIHRDWALMRLCLVAVGVASLVLALGSTFIDSAEMLTSSLLAGELVFTVGLTLFFRSDFQVGPRAVFLVVSALSLVLPLLVSYFWGDSLLTFALGLALMGATLFLVNRTWIMANLFHVK